MDNSGLGRILIIKPSSLGDVIQALPVAAAIKRAYPDSAIDWVVSSSFRVIVENCRYVDRAIIFDRNMFRGPGGFGKFRNFVSEIRRYPYSHVFDLQGLLRSGLMCLAARGRVKAGLANAREGATLFYGRKVELPSRYMHAVRMYLLFAGLLDIETDKPEYGLMPTGDGLDAARSLLTDCGITEADRFVVMAPSARWTSKLWPANNYIELANRLFDERGIRTLMVGTAGESSLMEGAGIGLSEGVLPVFGRSDITSLIALISLASATVGNDSGPTHLSVAVGTPTVAIFGPTSAGYTGPIGDRHASVFSRVDCAPCFKTECETLRCMDGVTVDKVLEATLKVLKEA